MFVFIFFIIRYGTQLYRFIGTDSNQGKFKEMLKEILDEKLEEKLALFIQSIEFMSRKFNELKIKTSELEESNKILRKKINTYNKNLQIWKRS